MADVTLSKAVRANLLNLQNTATQLGKTQERLATGLKVNSALDNPNNFFTASSLNARAGDLGRLLDAVSNATQTLETANNGLTSLIDLVENAQATTRAALQTVGQVTSNKIIGASAATFDPSSLTLVTGDNDTAGTNQGTITADTAATFQTGNTSIAADTAAVTATGTAQETRATLTGIGADATQIAAFTSLDLGTNATLLSATPTPIAATDEFTITVNGVTKTVVFDAASVGANVVQGADTVTIELDATVDEFATALDDLFAGTTQVNVDVAAVDGVITFTSDTSIDSIHFNDDTAGTLTATGLDLASVAISSDAGGGDHLITKNSDLQALIASGDTSLTLDVGGNGPQALTLGYGGGAEIATLAQLQAGLDGLTDVSAVITTGSTLVITTDAATGEDLAFAGDAAAVTALDISGGPTVTTGESTLASLGIEAGDTLVVSIDGVDNVITFDGTDTGTQGVNTLLLGVDQSLDTFSAQLNTLLGGNVTVGTSATGELSITSTTADTIRVRDGVGTATAELGLGAAGAGTATTDRRFSKNSTIDDLVAAGATLNLAVGNTNQVQIVFGYGAGEVSNRAELTAALDGLSGIDASYNAIDNRIDFSNSDSTDADSDIVVTADSAATLTALGFTADTGTPAVATSATTVNLLSQGKVVAGETLSIKIGTAAALNITFGNNVGQISTIAELNDKLQQLNAGAASVDARGEINITSDKGGDTIVIGGSPTPLASFGLVSGEVGNLIDDTNISDGDTLNIQVGTNALFTITFGTGTNEVNTFAELETALSNLAGGTASIDDDTGAITIDATNGLDSVTIYSTNSTTGDSVAESFGLINSLTPITSTVTDSVQRTTLEGQFNGLLVQINEIIQDTRFNGVNLLNGNDLEVLFNEDGTSTLDIQGVTFNANGLGLSNVAPGQFQTDTNLDDALAALDDAMATLRSQASAFGSHLSVVETRQDFTARMINTLETGAANLTLADTNEEAANLLALQTRQQLSSTALSLASEADQNVLRLF